MGASDLAPLNAAALVAGLLREFLEPPQAMRCSSWADEFRYIGFCAIGAIRQINGPHQQKAMNRLAKVVPDEDIAGYNDTEGRTRREMLRCFDKAIASRTR